MADADYNDDGSGGDDDYKVDASNEENIKKNNVNA